MPLDWPSTCAACGAELRAGSSRCESCQAEVWVDVVLTHVAPSATRLLDGRWQLGARLGEGGMGSVFLAHDVELDRPVAVKMTGASTSRELFMRFEREAKLLARVEHPNLVTVHAIGRTTHGPYIVMRRVAGETLTAMLRRCGRLSPEEALPLMRQLCAGLTALHAEGVVHRDVKPSNVMVGADGHVTLLDLGIARPVKSDLTESGMTVGTPEYMAPEQAMGDKAIDGRADLYSLGAVLFQLLTGERLFREESTALVIHAQVYKPARDVRELVPGLPPQLAAVVAHALEKRPAARPPSAQAFFDELNAAVTGASLAQGAAPVSTEQWTTNPQGTAFTAPTSVTTADRPRPKQRRVGLVAGAVALAALSSVAAVLLWRPAPVQVEAPPAPRASPAPVPTTIAEPSPPHAAPEPAVAPVETPPQRPARAARVARAPVEPAKPAEPAKPPEVAATPVVPAKGELRVMPVTRGAPGWGWLDIDGVRQGSAPTSLQLTPGTHVVRIESETGAVVERTVDIVAGQLTKLQVDLPAQ